MQTLGYKTAEIDRPFQQGTWNLHENELEGNVQAKAEAGGLRPEIEVRVSYLDCGMSEAVFILH